MKTIALVGNPNCGKTTLFNRLTGARAHVGNWPGVTVERLEGILREGTGKLVDLPGLYSLTTFTPEEAVTRDFLLSGETDFILNLVESRTLERSLYLTLQLLELDIPVTVVLSEDAGMTDCAALSKALGVPVFLSEDPMLASALSRAKKPSVPRYSRLLEGFTAEAVSVLAQAPPPKGNLRFWGLATLEGVPPACGKGQQHRLEEIRARLEKKTGKEADTYIAEERYTLITGALEKSRSGQPFLPKKEPADRLFLHRLLALPCLALVMAGMFWLCFGTLGQWIQRSINTGIEQVSQWTGTLLQSMEAASWLESLVCEGILGGVGTVLCFLPQLALLFLGMAFLEQSGYLARAAFLTDRALQGMGLSGRAFVPLLMGFGCTTTAVMSARTLRGEERPNTIQMLPYCSCGAKFPVYMLFAETFFPSHSGLAVAACYFMSLLFGTAVVKTRKTPDEGFLLELPPYRKPSFSTICLNTWERCSDFLRRAGTVLFLMSISLWLLRHITLWPLAFALPEESLLTDFADRMASFFVPLGFGNRESAVALLMGIAGKEAVVSSFGVLCEAGGSMVTLSQALGALFTPVSAVSFLVFFTLYPPCISALSAISRELSFWEALRMVLRQTAVAYAAAFIVYQMGMLLTMFLL